MNKPNLHTVLGIKPGEGVKINNYGGVGSQVLINSDRIIVNARLNYLMLFGQEGVAISSQGNVNIDADDGVTIFGEDGLYLGVPGKGNTANKNVKPPKTKADPTIDIDYEPIPLGQKLYTILDDILSTLKNAVILTSYGKAYFNEDVIRDLRSIQARLPEMLSTNIFIDGISHEGVDPGPTSVQVVETTNESAGTTVGNTTPNLGTNSPNPTTQINNPIAGDVASVTGSIASPNDISRNYHQSVDIYKDTFK